MKSTVNDLDTVDVIIYTGRISGCMEGKYYGGTRVRGSGV